MDIVHSHAGAPSNGTLILGKSIDLTGRREGGSGEQPPGPDVRQLVARLQALILEDEVAAEVAVQATAMLPVEQLQTVQVGSVLGRTCMQAPRGAA